MKRKGSVPGMSVMSFIFLSSYAGLVKCAHTVPFLQCTLQWQSSQMAWSHLAHGVGAGNCMLADSTTTQSVLVCIWIKLPTFVLQTSFTERRGQSCCFSGTQLVYQERVGRGGQQPCRCFYYWQEHTGDFEYRPVGDKDVWLQLPTARAAYLTTIFSDSSCSSGVRGCSWLIVISELMVTAHFQWYV